jgi:hypothetical protein
MRQINIHKAPGVNDWVRVETVDDPDKDGRCWKYQLYTRSFGGEFHKTPTRIEFQQGDPKPLEEGGLNGISEESLLAVIVDRLACQSKIDSEDIKKAALRFGLTAILNTLKAGTWVEEKSAEEPFEKVSVSGKVKKTPKQKSPKKK